MAGRAERPPDPTREHPIGQAIYALSRGGWSFLYQAKTRGFDEQAVQRAKDSLKGDLDAIKALIDAF